MLGCRAEEYGANAQNNGAMGVSVQEGGWSHFFALHNVFVSNCKMYLSQSAKCNVLKIYLYQTMVRWVCLSTMGGLGWNHFFALSCQNSHGQGSHRMILQKGHKHKISNKNGLGSNRVILQNDTTI